MSNELNKKPHLYNLFVADDTTRISLLPFENRTNRQVSSDFSTLDTSTVPTYEEFITKTTKKDNLNKFLLNSTHANATVVDGLVTDDDSSSGDESNDENDYKPKFVVAPQQTTPKTAKTISENEENLLLKSFNKMNLVKGRENKTPSSPLTKTLSKNQTPSIANVNSPLLINKHSKLLMHNSPFTPKNLMKNSPRRQTDSDEYIAHACISTQTSFVESPKVIVDDSVIEISPNQSLKYNASKDVSNGSGSGSGGGGERATAANFVLRLSSSSTSPQSDSPPDTSNFHNITVRRSGCIKNTSKNHHQHQGKKHSRLSITSGKYVSVSKTNKKRVSVCGEGFSEDILQIDETILDEYENELDLKKGKLFIINESDIEKDTNASYNNYDVGQLSIINETCGSQTEIVVLDSSSDEQPIREVHRSDKKSPAKKSPFLKNTNKKKLKEDTSSSEDKFENFLNNYKTNSKVNTTSKQSNLNDFIVDTESNDESSEFDDLEDEFSIKEKDDSIKKQIHTNKNRLILKSSSSSCDDEKPAKTSRNKNRNSDDSDENKYGNDLHLFYIKTTNLLNKNKIRSDSKEPTSKKKHSRSKTNRSSLLNDSTSFISLSSSSESSSESNSDTSISSSSSLSPDDSFRRKFKTKFPKSIFKQPENDSRFKTPNKLPKSREDLDSRLIKTQGVFSKKNSTSKKLSFVESLSTILENEDQRDPTVLIYMKKFKNKAVKTELLQKCYNEINRVSFDNQLPADLKLVWSGRLSSTGGYCKNITKSSMRSSEIHVSTKVCDSPERMRDTLAHEMCHAAAFLINGLLDGHGSVWKSWANRVNFTFKKIPKITVTHSYEIKKKFIFKCQTCKFEIHRFSKSIDVNKELCGLCHGRFEIILNNKNDKNKIEENLDNDDRFDRIKNDDYEFKTSSSSTKLSSAIENAVTRTPNKFAMYVKENYNTIKKDKNLNNHKDVMQELSKNFKQLSAK